MYLRSLADRREKGVLVNIYCEQVAGSTASIRTAQGLLLLQTMVYQLESLLKGTCRELTDKQMKQTWRDAVEFNWANLLSGAVATDEELMPGRQLKMNTLRKDLILKQQVILFTNTSPWESESIFLYCDTSQK